MRARRTRTRSQARGFIVVPDDRFFALVQVLDAVSWSSTFELLVDRGEFQRMVNDPTTQEYRLLWSRDYGPTPSGLDLLDLK